jgi:hypothetical protein
VTEAERITQLESDLDELVDLLFTVGIARAAIATSPGIVTRTNASRERRRAREAEQVTALHAKRLAARIAQDDALELVNR